MFYVLFDGYTQCAGAAIAVKKSEHRQRLRQWHASRKPFGVKREKEKETQCENELGKANAIREKTRRNHIREA